MSAIGPGLPHDLARRRAETISNVRYDLHYTIADEIRGRVTVRFDLSRDDTVVLDWQGGHLTFDGRRGAYEWTHEFVPGDSIHREPDFVYTLFVPDRASRAFPCFDQPDLKAEFTLTLDLPDGWVSTQTTRAKLPTYLFAFAAGRFEVVEDARGYRMFHRESDAAKVARSAPTIFDLHDASRRWIEAYTDYPCPFGRDFVLIPGFPYRGMEHPGCIFYRDTTLLLDESPTQEELLARASVIAHETAHLWFGDLVTMRWFDDVWTKESFANFMADKLVAEWFPELDHDLRFFTAHYPAAADVDRSRGTHALHQPLDNLADAGSLYGALIYKKSPIVLRQMERVAGEEAFRDGLREHLRTYAFANASWPELVAILDRHTPADLAAFSRAWVYEPGRPTIRTSGAVLTSDPPRPQRVEVLLGPAVRSVLLVDRLELDGDPPFVLPIAYGRVILDARSEAWLRDHLAELDDALARGAAIETLWDGFLHGGADVTDVFTRALATEPNELNVQLLLSKLGELTRRYAPPTPELEQLLWERMEAAGSPTLEATLFKAWREIVASPEGVVRLERVWREPPMPLSERDLSAIALTLGVRGVDVLDAQAARIADPERTRWFAFVRRAVEDPDGFFDSLRTPEGRRPEPWVLEALWLLHHPTRENEKYVLPSLELLEEIQRTGDIFFPHGFIEATLSGHRSAEAARIVEEFLAARPNYPPRLRLKILQAADGLFRAAGR